MQDESNKATLAAVRELYTRLGTPSEPTLKGVEGKLYCLFEQGCPRQSFKILRKCELGEQFVDILTDRIAGRSCVVMPWYASILEPSSADAWHAVQREFVAACGEPRESRYEYAEIDAGGLRMGRMSDGYGRHAYVVYVRLSGFSSCPRDSEFDGVSDEEALAALDGID